MIGLYCPQINFVNIKKRLKNLFTKYFFYLEKDIMLFIKQLKKWVILNPLSHTEKKNLDKSNPYKFAELFYNISEKNSLEKLNEFNKICKGFLIGSGQL